MSLPTAFVGLLGCALVVALPFAYATLSPPTVSRQGFEALQPGMDRATAERVVGHPGQETLVEATAAGDRRTVVWLNPDGSNVHADFAGGRLVSKTAERIP